MSEILYENNVFILNLLKIKIQSNLDFDNTLLLLCRLFRLISARSTDIGD